jgi:hypothetical protein
MSRKARHLQILEDSKKYEYNLDKPSKKRTLLIKIVQDSRDDQHKHEANLYGISLGFKPPNKMSYETNNDYRKKVNQIILSQ